MNYRHELYWVHCRKEQRITSHVSIFFDLGVSKMKLLSKQFQIELTIEIEICITVFTKALEMKWQQTNSML